MRLQRGRHNLATKQLCLYMCAPMYLCVCAGTYAPMHMCAHLSFHIYVCVCMCMCMNSCASVCVHLHGGMSVRCLCVCAYMGTDQLSVYLGDTVSGYHVIAYDKLRVSYDNNDIWVPFPRMSKLIQVHI